MDDKRTEQKNVSLDDKEGDKKPIRRPELQRYI